MLQYLETNRLFEELREISSNAPITRQGEAFISDFVKINKINEFYLEWVLFGSRCVLESSPKEKFYDFLLFSGIFTNPLISKENALVVTSRLFWQVFRTTPRLCSRLERCYQFHYGRTPGPIGDFFTDSTRQRNRRVELVDEALSDKGIEEMFGERLAPYFIAKAKRFIEIGDSYPVHSKDNMEERRLQIRCATALRLCIVAINFRMTANSGRIWIEDYCKELRAAERKIKKLKVEKEDLYDDEMIRALPNNPGFFDDIIGSLLTVIERGIIVDY